MVAASTMPCRGPFDGDERRPRRPLSGERGDLDLQRQPHPCQLQQRAGVSADRDPEVSREDLAVGLGHDQVTTPAEFDQAGAGENLQRFLDGQAY